jgi:uncharacterized protein (TIGR03067 family)
VIAQLSDLDLIQGAWLQVDLEENGVSNPPDELSPPGAVTTFRENQFEVRTIEGILLLEGSFELDPLASPKAVDWIDAIGPDAGKRLPAIYKLEMENFVFIAADPDSPRPEVFRTGPGQTMRTFIRKPKLKPSISAFGAKRTLAASKFCLAEDPV